MPESDFRKRRFIKTLWGGAVVFGAGILGFPMGSCARNRASAGPLDLSQSDVDALPELTEEELDQFMQEVRDAQTRYEETLADSPDHIDTKTDSGQSAPDHLDAAPDAGAKPRIPPGQFVVETIPVLGSNASPRTKSDWRFYVKGQVDTELLLTWDEFKALAQVEQSCDIHCVTTWSVLDVKFGGVRVRTLLEKAGLKPEASHVVFDCEKGYTTNIDLTEAKKDNVMIATSLYGRPLPLEYGGLARGLVPDRYYYKSGKWVVGIRVLDHDEPGFWEIRGYSNSADPWKEERYS